MIHTSLPAGVVACTRLVMSTSRKPFKDHGFGEEMRALARVFLTLNGPSSQELLNTQLLDVLFACCLLTCCFISLWPFHLMRLAVLHLADFLVRTSSPNQSTDPHSAHPVHNPQPHPVPPPEVTAHPARLRKPTWPARTIAKDILRCVCWVRWD